MQNLIDIDVLRYPDVSDGNDFSFGSILCYVLCIFYSIRCVQSCLVELWFQACGSFEMIVRSHILSHPAGGGHAPVDIPT